MHKTTLIVCSVLLGFAISASPVDWESAVEEIRDELRKSMAEIKDLKERFSEAGVPSFHGFDSLDTGDRASLGIYLEQGIDQKLVVAGFSRHSNARESGVQEGDVLIAIDAQDLTGDHATHPRVIEYLESIEPGAEVILSVVRGDEELQFTIQTHSSQMFGWLERELRERGNRPSFRFRDESPGQENWWIGRLPQIEWDRSLASDGDIQVTDLNEALGSYFKVDAGVLVLKAGEESTLEPGDVIIAVGDQKVANTEELYEELKDGKGSVTVQRHGDTIELSIAETLEGLRLEREVRIFSSQSNGSRKSRVW